MIFDRIISKRYRIKDKTLKFLLQKQLDLRTEDVKLTKTSHFDIGKAIGVEPVEILQYHESLIDRKHIECAQFEEPPHHFITLTLDGRTAALESIHYLEGKKDLHETVFMFFSWSIPILALIVSCIGTWNSFNSESESKKLQQEIDLIKQQLLQAERRTGIIENQVSAIPDSLFRQSPD